MRVTNDWKPITHLVDVGLNNRDGLLWEFLICKYTSEERKEIRGMPIGNLDSTGFHSNPRDSDRIYKMVFTSDGKVMFFEKNRHIQELQDSVRGTSNKD